jgi:tripartite-type tricarboxylate transporter receptor subunit TctC
MRRLAFPVAVAAVLSALSCAQAYPTKPMRVIASSAPGGISDIFMRALGEELQKRWG